MIQGAGFMGYGSMDMELCWDDGTGWIHAPHGSCIAVSDIGILSLLGFVLSKLSAWSRRLVWAGCFVSRIVFLEISCFFRSLMLQAILFTY